MSQLINTPLRWSLFPKYLGYAIAHLPSKRIEKNSYSVAYHFDEHKVYDVELSIQGATIHHYWENEKIETVQGDTIQQALESLYAGKHYYQSPLHKTWVTAVSRAGNILIRYVCGDEPTSLVYPSLQREQIVIPIPMDEPERFELIQSIASHYPHRLQRYSGVLSWHQRSDNTQQKVDVALICIILPIAYVPAFIREVSPAIIPGRLWRAYADPFEGDVKIGASFYQGNPNDSFRSYTLIKVN